jgi:asparagine synthase (glutamine-hydrolysing)
MTVVRRGAWQMTPRELAAGFVLGLDPGARLSPAPPGPPSAREAFEQVVREALRHPPCVVSFSGGRDSSAVLAVAARIARTEGLPAPVAVSLRFARVPSAEESAWQETVIGQVGGVDWHRVDVDTELDLLGPLATAEITRHGVLWPANTAFHAPIAPYARGGTLLTGFGGDEIMSPGWAWDRLNRVLTRRARPAPSDLVELLASHAPQMLRRRVLDRRPEPSAPSPWLRPEVDAWAQEEWKRLRDLEPVRHDRAVLQHWWSSRYVQVTRQSLALLAAGHGAAVAHPFNEPRFLQAVARERGRAGPVHRSRETIRLFSDVLPRETLVRVGKATFNGAFWGPETQAFVADWDGSGVDDDLVDVERLAAVWAGADPDARTWPLLQSAWASRVS